MPNEFEAHGTTIGQRPMTVQELVAQIEAAHAKMPLQQWVATGEENNALCSGWLGCHGPSNLVAMRLHHAHVEPETFDYTTDVPLFSSGAEAAAHGLSGIEAPSAEAKRAIGRLYKKQARRKA